MGFSLAKRIQHTPSEPPKAAQAFTDYVALGPKRSLRWLAREYVEQGRYKTEQSAMRSLRDWSVRFGWQARIRDAASALSMQMLEDAAEIDAETFLLTTRIMNETVRDVADGKRPMDPLDMIRIRETVRKAQPRGATNVNVHLDVQISQVLDQIAEEDGLTEIERKQLEQDVREYLEASTP